MRYICENPPIERTKTNVRIINGLIRARMARYTQALFLIATIDWDKLEPYIYNPKGYYFTYEVYGHQVTDTFHDLGKKSWETIQGWYLEYKQIDNYDFSI